VQATERPILAPQAFRAELSCMDDRIAGPFEMEAPKLVRTWTLAFITAVGLFFVPVVNGILAGAFGAMFDSGVKRTLGHSIAASLLLWPLLWILAGYNADVFGWRPDQTVVPFLCVGPLIVTALFVSIVKSVPGYNPRAAAEH
jgi:hypothetical protein